VFQLALANMRRFEWRGVPFAAWLYRMAANALADYWRRQARRLPELQRRVIEMRFVHDKSVRDVAVALDRSEGAVKQLQLRALENLRKGMGVNG
jgi:RNA polymerase sigma-70 factor (ECF subfamily)